MPYCPAERIEFTFRPTENGQLGALITPFPGGRSWLRTIVPLAIISCVFTFGCKGQSQLVHDDEQCVRNVANHPEVAIPYCTSLVESAALSQKNHALALILRGTAYRNMGNLDAAIQDFSAAIRVEPDIANAFNNRGITYDYKHEFARAIRDYDEAIRLRPDYPDAFNNRGLVFREEGEYKRALQDFDQAVRLKPGYAEAIANRASTYIDVGNYDRAIEEFTSAIKVEPDYGGDFNDRAEAYLGKKEYQRALDDLNRAVTLSPRDPHFLESRGIARFCVGSLKGAKDDLLLASKLAPTEPSIAVWLYLVQARLGENPREAFKKNQARLKRIWPEPAVRFFLGRLTSTEFLALAGSTDAGKESERRCQAYFFLGEAALIHHNPGRARELFQKSAKMQVPISYGRTGAIAELDRMRNGNVVSR